MFSFLLSFSSIAAYQISGISTITSSYKMSEIPDFSCYGSSVAYLINTYQLLSTKLHQYIVFILLDDLF